MISPNENTGGQPQTNADLAATPYGRQRRLCYVSKACIDEFRGVVAERMQDAADNPPEFFARAVAVARYLQQTQQALSAMPGREFFRDPAEELVGSMLWDLVESLKRRAGPKGGES